MVSEKLREMITERGVKQKWLAEKIGVSEATLSAMLNGKQSIDVDVFFGIATAMRMTPDEIVAFKKSA
jgi:transcriptional regulator with XRE-family HTH domain